MKFIVDKLPTACDCPFSRWKPYPPIVEEPGIYVCTLDNRNCNLSNNGCRYLKSVEEGGQDA